MNFSRGTRILIIKMSSIGDIVHSLPAVHSIKVGLNASIDWVVHPLYATLVSCFMDVDGIVNWPRSSSVRDFIKGIKALRTVEYDIVIDFQGLFKSAIVSYFSRSTRKIGHILNREGAFLFYNEKCGNKKIRRHAIERYYDFVSYLNIPMLPVSFPITYPHLDSVPADESLVGILPFSRWQSKTWPLNFFIQVANELYNNFGITIVLFGSEDDKRLASDFEREYRGKLINLVGKLSFPYLVSWLAKLQFLISNDSGPMHLAVAVGTPVIALFGPTDPVRTGPYGSIHKVLTAKLNCQPCLGTKCKFKDTSCMRSITPELVLSEAFNMLKQVKG